MSHLCLDLLYKDRPPPRQVPCSGTLHLPLPDLLYLRLLVNRRLHQAPSPCLSSAHSSIQGRLSLLTTKTRGPFVLLHVGCAKILFDKCTTTW
ncbi:hypothetical protein TRIUR3_32710 [Triticum urartu]|uniref:Uncharacterized protein n=1 Tax=Triticum urartu TaxID=4572 RepID=M7Z400_TRIUA|nr:hypothetical protein TRIUR3_32710 [Triticum urartu]